MMRLALLLLAFLTFAPASLAQSDEEIKFNQKQAKELHGYAEDALKAGFPRIAKRVWLMLLSEYDPDFEKARKALGYERVGESWALNPTFVYPTEDNPDAKKASSLQKGWESLSKKVADAHRREAENYQKAGRTDMARKHFEKVIFFDAEDEDAQVFLNHKPVEGLTGTDLEQTLYERSKKIEKIVAEQARTDYQVEVLDESEKHPFLENAKVTYRSVRSEHFTVRGDFEVDLLVEAAKNMERAMRVMEVVAEGYTGFSPDPARWISDNSHFQDKDSYVQILKANADLMTAESLAFRIEHTRASALIQQGTALGIGAPLNEQGVYDSAVRSVAQSYSGLRTPALREGIGHTIVGMMFNNNRQFIVDRREQLRTTTGEEDIERFSPNMDTWKDLALEAAWKLSEGTPAANLPLITADKFPDDARIKSWSFVDYLVRRDPTLMHALDKLTDQRHPLKVESQFAEENDVTLAQLEKEWKDFWTEASPVLKAIKNNTPPLATVNKDVAKWLEAFNKERKERGVTEVTWSADYSGRCREHVQYLITNEEERGPDKLQGQNPELEGGSHLGHMFAQMALVSAPAPKKPKDLFNDWMHVPGYRDALINQSLRTIGLYYEDDVLVVDAIRGLGRAPEGKGGYAVYPSNTRDAIPTSIEISQLSSEVRRLFENAGHTDLEEVGYPISLHHFGNGGLPGNRDSYKCVIRVQGEEVEGLMHIADGGGNRRTSAPGMVVFYPLKPLRKGMEHEVVWTFEYERGTARTAIKFNT
ncbi:MAG: CAP domain-containing protein [Planctomycetota bacterium]|nr:CAP domain-containing protein [Planctomycetota bacterium]